MKNNYNCWSAFFFFTLVFNVFITNMKTGTPNQNTTFPSKSHLNSTAIANVIVILQLCCLNRFNLYFPGWKFEYYKNYSID